MFSSLTHREPLLDEVDFERFVQAIDPLMQAGRDVLWVLAGRTDSSVPKIRKIVAQYGFNIEAFYLVYNTKQMQQYGYWQRQRGISNSKSVEQAFYAYKGRTPKLMPKNRHYVDHGSSLFNQLMKNVPVLAPKLQAFVTKGVRETSLESMLGVPHDEDAGEKVKIKLLHQEDIDDAGDQPHSADPPPADKIARASTRGRKNRNLYQQLTGMEVPWFPHDNAIDLLMELVWEAGRPRWVFSRDTSGWRRRSWLLGGGLQRRGRLLRRASSDPLDHVLVGVGRGGDG